MSRIERSAIVRRPASVMFQLVHDVEGYPGRFRWCEHSAILQRGENELVARLDLRMAGISQSFTTRNRFEPDRRIDLGLVDGPFSRLAGAWVFQPLTEEACKVSLALDFEMAGRFVGSALAGGFRTLADKLVDEFVREARRGP
ncbi:MAG: type II toxin-antitoxin system RatA family toxin [Xanthomonadales bacterium]|nr:type II toxin-antitoxin system RatA family toxin [Xanthomonadales bacterium]